MTDPLDPPVSSDPTELPVPAAPTDTPEPTEPAEIASSSAFEAPARTRFAEPVATPPAELPDPAGTPDTPEAPEPAEIAAPTFEPPAPVPAEPAPLEPVAAPVPVTLPQELPPVPTPVAAEPEPAEVEPHVRTGRGLVTSLAVVVALLAGLTGFLGYEVSATAGPGPDQKARQPALQAVRSAAVLLFSYDYRHLQADFTAGRAVTTGKFQSEYDKTTDKLVKDVAPRYKAVVIASVSEASVVSATEDEVVALVFVNQQSSSTLTAAPKVTQSRLLMTLVHQRGRWLVRDISPR